jgi:D-apionolactonase
VSEIETMSASSRPGKIPQPPSRAVMLCGTQQQDPPARLLRAGPLSVELESGALRYVRLHGIEVLRGIAYLVRDANWGTFTPAIADLQIREEPGQFLVSYRAECADAQRCLTYEATISGLSDGTLAFEVTAEAKTDVLTNRTGFVVLHPAALAGRPVRVTHADGRTETRCFPELISPAQPMLDIRALEHEITPGVWASVVMQGDAFEMEDQRNWGDASYKTYVGSLLKPWPYTLLKDSRHTQSVCLSISGSLVSVHGGDEASVTAFVGSATGVMPAIGIGVPAEEAQHAVAALDVIRHLGPRFLVCRVDLRNEIQRTVLAAFRRLAAATGAETDLETVIADGSNPMAELARLSAALRDVSLRPASLSVSTAADLKSWQPGQDRPNEPSAAAIAAAARTIFPGVRLGGGVLSYFTELNRKRPNPELFDHIGHTTCPIVHAADDRSVMETLEALPAVIASTRVFAGGRPYRIGPSAIGCRENPYGAAPFENPENHRVCLARVDPRQRGLFAAAYLLGYGAACARGGIEAVAFGAPTGPFGVIHRRGDYPSPYFDTLEAAAVYPAFHVVAGLARAAAQPRLELRMTRPGLIEGLGWSEDGRTVLWIANLAATTVPIRMRSKRSPRPSQMPRSGSRPMRWHASPEPEKFRAIGDQQLDEFSTRKEQAAMNEHRLKEFAGTAHPKFGHFIVEFATPGIGHILQSAGCEFVLFDLEHSGFGVETVKRALRYFEAADLPAIVRVPSKDYHHIARILDLGAEGLMVPMVGTAAQARQIVHAMKYAPEGGRGVALQVAHDRYRPGPVPEKFANANRRTTLFCQIETAEGVENAEAIAAVTGVDCLWVGHFDLSASLGVPGEFQSRTFLDAIDQVVRAARKHGKALGRLVPNVETGADYYRRGFSFICYSGDVWVLHDALAAAVGRLREACAATKQEPKP